MVKPDIMKMTKLNDIQSQTKIIDHERFDQFVVGVISWYQHEITHPKVYFEQPERLIQKPPNLFYLFEYPNHFADCLANHFTDSDTKARMNESELSYEQARNETIEMFNSSRMQEWMTHDVKLILNGYRLFYRYQDDATSKERFYNSYVKEVW